MRRMRGSRTTGYGQIGQHRHSGQQGGHGNAGLHKHKWSWMIINEPDHFGKRPVHRAGRARGLEVAQRRGARSDAHRKAPDGPGLARPHLDGRREAPRLGDVKHAFNVKVESFTERAKTKLEEAGGKIVA